MEGKKEFVIEEITDREFNDSYILKNKYIELFELSKSMKEEIKRLNDVIETKDDIIQRKNKRINVLKGVIEERNNEIEEKEEMMIKDRNDFNELVDEYDKLFDFEKKTRKENGILENEKEQLNKEIVKLKKRINELIDDKEHIMCELEYHRNHNNDKDKDAICTMFINRYYRKEENGICEFTVLIDKFINNYFTNEKKTQRKKIIKKYLDDNKYDVIKQKNVLYVKGLIIKNRDLI